MFNSRRHKTVVCSAQKVGPDQTDGARDSLPPHPVGMCFVCGYDLRGHLNTFRCPECNTLYDDKTRVWRTKVTRWHFRSYGGPAQIMLVGFAIGGRAANSFVGTLSDAAAISLLGLLLVGIIGAYVMRRRHTARGWTSYIAVAPAGLFVSKSGCPHKFKVIDWGVVRSRLEGKGRRWRYGSEVVQSLHIHLDIRASRELFGAMLARVAAQSEGNS